MIDALVTFAIAPAGDVIALDLWDGIPPETTARMLQVEPHRWWLIDATAERNAIAERIGERGTLTPIGGGMMRAILTGSGWRELLTISGCFDVEDPRFAPGHVAGTVIHHVPVWIAPISDTVCEVYLPASYATTLVDMWSRSATEQRGPP